jgi:EAL domain-containing protein (putative c-di-GMP-specific phosphodiesterase class I)
VAVNVSVLQFRHGTLLCDVLAALEDSGLAANRLEIEITESVMMQDSPQTIELLNELRRLGVRVAMDDFGTGFSSLSYLRSFPFDRIKIDRSFVRDVDNHADARAIVRAIAGMGRSLGIAVTAEGVETPTQLDAVRQDGCDEVQGYLFSKPRPACEIPGLIVTAAAACRDLRRSGRSDV